MLHKHRRTILEMLAAIRYPERRRQHYSRALGWTIAALLIAGVVLGFVAASGDMSRQPACRAAAQGEPINVEPLALELARMPADLVRLLGNDSALSPGLDPAVCLEERVASYRDILGLDSTLFIPLYVLLGTLVLSWMLVVRMRVIKNAQKCKNDQKYLPKPGCVVALALASTAVMLITAALDAAENQAAQHVLDLAVGQGALLDDASTSLPAAIDAMRNASLCKWLAAGVWVATFVGMAWLLRHAVASAKGERDGKSWPKFLSNLLVVIGLLAALTLLAGALLGWFGLASTDGWVRGLLRAGFALYFIVPFIVVVLQVSHVKILHVNPENEASKITIFVAPERSVPMKR